MGMAEEEVKRRTQDCMRIFDLEALADKAPYHLSGGQKKKTALAAVMSLDQKLSFWMSLLQDLTRKVNRC